MRLSAKKWMVSFILGCVVMLMFAGLSYAQDNWVYWFDNPWYQNKDDCVNDLVVSPSNKTVFLTGSAYINGSYNYFLTIAIDAATGDTIWKYLYAPDPTDHYGTGNEIIYGPDDYLYVAGSYYGSSGGGHSFVIIKLDTLGNLIASNEYDLYSNNSDVANTVAYGPDNMVYVGGNCRDNDNYQDFLVRKYNTSLVYQGVQYRQDEGSYSADCFKVVVAPDTTIWAGGYERGIQKQWVTYKFNSSLAVQHKFTYDGASSGNDECQSLALPWSGSDGVYAVGYAYEGSGHSYDFTVFKLKQDGTKDWKYQYDRAGAFDRGYAICTGPSGAVYAAGYSKDSTGEDYTVLCLQFGLAWAYVFDGSNNGDDCAYDIAINSAGNTIYACGYTTTDHGSKGSSKDLIVTRHTLASGTPTWTYIYDGNNNTDYGNDLSIGTDGNIYVGGDVTLTGSYNKMAAISLPDNFPPTVPELVSPADNGYENNLTVTFTWNASEDPETSVSGYYAAYSLDSTFATYDSVWSTDTTENVVLTDATWYWAVRAKDSNGNLSKFSEIWSFQFDLTDPVAPVLTSPINDPILLDTSVTFVWQPVTFNREVPSPVTYIIQVDTTSGFSSPLYTDTTDLLTKDEELPGEFYYYWHVMAYDAAGNQGPYSGTETFMVDLNDPLIDGTYHSPEWTPGPFDVFSQVIDTWGIAEVVLHYKRTEDPAFFPDTMAEGSDDWYLGEIPAITTGPELIQYYIWAIDNAGKESRDPDTLYYEFVPTTDVEENPGTINVFAFNVKGNLIKGKATFNLSLPKSSSVTLEIYDASGRLVATPATGNKPAGNHTITWTPQTNGVYFYSLKSPFGNKTGKILFVR